MTRSYTAKRREIAALRLSTQQLSTQQLSTQQLGTQRILAPAAGATAADTVRHLLAMQAQDFAGAKWSVGLRTPGTTDASIEASLAAGEIVRSWPMRGTLHFVAPEDLGWMLSLTAERIIRSTAGRQRDLELTDDDFARARDVAEQQLSGGRELTRDGLLEQFVAAGVPTNGQRGIHLLQRLCLDRVTVFGPLRGRQHTFVLFDEWVRSPRVLEREEALGEFALRYFTGHGPATVRDFAWWSSLTLTDARRGLEIARPGLDELQIDGTSYFLPRDAVSAKRPVHALPGFDEFLLGYQDRSAPLAPEHSELIVPGKNGMFLSTIVVNGEVVGTWRRTTTTKGVSTVAQPFASLSARDSASFDAAMSRYARFLGRALVRP